MSITIFEKDETVARMLFLEAKRQGFREERGPALFLVDLDDFDLPKDLPDGCLCMGLSRFPQRLSQSKRESVFALLSLPFSVAEFEENLYRFRGNVKNDVLRITEGRVTQNGRAVALSKTERAVLDLLYHNRERVVSEQEIAAVIGESANESNAVAVYLYRLRRKLCADGQSRIKTARGKGYQWIEKTT